MVAMIALGASWYLVSRAEHRKRRPLRRRQARATREVLNTAKQALIGYVAAQAAKAGENNPGALPCPEAAGVLRRSPAKEGTVASAARCRRSAAFPWRTIGIDKLVDRVGRTALVCRFAGMGRTSSGSTDRHQLRHAAGPAHRRRRRERRGRAHHRAGSGVQRARVGELRGREPGARNHGPARLAQLPRMRERDLRRRRTRRSSPRGPSGSFNDQVVAITVADIMPAIEAADRQAHRARDRAAAADRVRGRRRGA